VREVRAGRAGRVVAVSPLRLGRAVLELGGGRTRLGESIDPRVGFVLHVSPGEAVTKGGVLASVHAADEATAERGRAAVLEAVSLAAEGDPRPGIRAPVSHRVTRDGVERVGE
jgi:thymidine phosphorylase